MSDRPHCRAQVRYFALGAGLVLGLAAGLRLVALDTIPGGLHFDLAAYLFDAVEVIDGARPVYFPRNTGREPFVIYLYALVGAGLGATPFAARLVTDAFGMLGVGAVGFAARQALRLARPLDRAGGDAAALLAAGLMAGLYWAVHFSRFGLRTGALPAILALAFGFLLRGMRDDLARRRRALDFALAGVFLGLGLESYTAARLAPPAALLPLLVGLAAERRPRWLGRIVIVIGVAAVVFAPLAVHFLRYPADFGTHSYENSVLNPAVNGGDPIGTTLRAARETASAYLVTGSPGGAENLPGRPIFDPVAGIAFVVGLALLVVWLRGPLPRALSGLTLCGWLGMLSLSSALSLPAPGFVRLSGAIPAAAVVAGIGALVVARWSARLGLCKRLGPRGRALPGVLVGVCLVAIPAAWTARDYFGTWNREVRYRAAMVDKADAAAYLMSFPAETRLFLAPLWASDFGVQFLTRSRRLETFSIGAGAVIPTDPTRPVVYAFPYEDVGGARALSALLPGAPPPVLVRDASGRYDLLWVLRYQPTPALAPTRLQRLEDGLAFAGAEVRTGGPDGASIDVALRWLAVAPTSRRYTVFVQLRDGGTVAQHDGQPIDGTAPTDRWQAGDLVIDRHTLRAPRRLDGRYRLYAGLYDGATGKRLRLLDDAGNPAPVDELLLGQL